MAIKKIEIQDSEGNVYHPHTDAGVVYMPDGTDVKTSISTNKNDISNLKTKTDATNNILNPLKTKVDSGQNFKLTYDDGNAFGISYGDANNCNGYGSIYTGENITNSPDPNIGQWWTIENYKNGDYGHQVATHWFDNRRYIRNCRAGNWTSWREL